LRTGEKDRERERESEREIARETDIAVMLAFGDG